MNESAILRKLEAIDRKLQDYGSLEKPYLSLEEAARYTCFEVSTLHAWISIGELKPFNEATKTGEYIIVRRRVKFLRAQLEKWMWGQRQQAIAEPEKKGAEAWGLQTTRKGGGKR